MNKNRLEAFSDGVIAIIITIMVLELRPPHGHDWEKDIHPLLLTFLSYWISFINLGIYWVNHHHLLHTVKKVNGRLIWANLHLLFWLSLMPFATAWMGESGFSSETVAIYAILACMCGVGYFMLLLEIRRTHQDSPGVQEILKHQFKKGTLSVILYVLAIPGAYIHPWVAGILFLIVAVIWFYPDKKIERTLTKE